MVSICLSQVGKDTDFWDWSEEKPHHASIVKIRIIGQGWTSMGTGTAISDYKILTAEHVVDTATTFLIETKDGKRYSAVIGPVDEDSDVAIIVTQTKMDLPHIKVSDKDPTEADKVEACGYGGDGKLRHFFATSKLYSGQVLGVDAYTIPGDSGGPILNENHEIVGVISGGLAWSSVKKIKCDDDIILPTWPMRCGGLEAIKKVIVK
jgi:S1-C subfamily serine protease